jgi:site-specific DNA recombinase
MVRAHNEGNAAMNAIGYIRRSTDKQEMSLPQQRAKLEQFAVAKGWKLVQVFVDDAISGSDMKRPGLEQLLACAKGNRDVRYVLAWERNRLARPKDPMDGMILERELLSYGKEVFYAATGQRADRSFASGLISYVEHHQSGDYLRKLSRDTVRGIVHRVERGYWPGGPIPFGYDRQLVGGDGKPARIVRDLPDRSQALIDPSSGQVMERIAGGHRYTKQDFELCTLILSEPARVAAVQKMFADYAAGAPIRILRDQLNHSGMRTARGRIFTPQTIHAMLENPAYVGRCVYNRRTESKWHRLLGGASVERQDEGLELRPQSDWIIKENAWPAIIDKEAFAQVQSRRKASKEQYRKVVGHAIYSEYLLSGLIFCGVCGGRMIGQTTKSGKGYRTRYYVCGTHHRGDHEACPHRYNVPAGSVEDHILGLIKDDLVRLRDDQHLHEYVAQELQRITGGQNNASEQLQRRLADLDQQAAGLRDHFKSLDAETAKALGLYDEARRIADERKMVEHDLNLLPAALPQLPDAGTVRTRAKAAFDQLEAVLASATIEQRRELVGLYVQNIKADPATFSVQISLYPALFTEIIAGGGFEPPTSGL